MKREYYGVGYGVNNKEAQVLGPEIERLAAQHGGGVTAWHILSEARDPASPFHSHVTWDDHKAAEQWRLNECRTLLDNVKVRIIQPDGTVQRDGPLVISAGEQVRIVEGSQEYNLRPYVLVEVLQQRPDQHEAVIQEARALLLSFRKRLQTLDSLFVRRYPAVERVQQSLEEFALEVEREEVGEQLAAA